MRRDVFWIPALLVGSALYWTVAMRLGSMSVGVLGSASEDLELVPAVTIDVDIVEEPVNVVLQAEEPAAETEGEGETYEAEEIHGDPIVVRLQPWVDGPGMVGTPDRESGTGGVGCAAGGGEDGRREPPPPPVEDSIGRTAF